ncbi:MAG: hypothetical protein NTU73_07225 [Ignavibacteriae bacterium]|nr:hypothetical protein [Ignavibacteriota bacterium]
MKKTIFLKCFIIIFLFANICSGQNYNWSLLTARGNTSHIFIFPNSKGWIFGGKIAYKTLNGGENWSNPIIMNPTIGGSVSSSDLMFSDTSTGWMGIGNEIRKTTNGGISWIISNINNNISAFSVYFINNNTGWVGGQGNYNSGALFKTTNGGINWFNQNIGYWKIVHFIKMFSENKGLFGSRDSDTIGFTSDGGTTWQKIKVGNGQPITKLFFLDSLNGWALGNYQYISKTSNGGLNWTLIPTNIYNTTSIYFINMDTGWVGTPGGVCVENYK